MKVNAILLMLLILAIGFSYCNKNGEKPEELEDPKIKWFPVGATWCYLISNAGYYEVTFTVEKDTVVDGIVCQIIRGETPHNVHTDIVYEENGSVYFYFDNKFRKTYDFNVKTGDVVELEVKAGRVQLVGRPWYNRIDSTIAFTHTIGRTPTMLVNGVELREICFYGCTVEKVGPESSSRPFEGIFRMHTPGAYPASYSVGLRWYKRP